MEVLGKILNKLNKTNIPYEYMEHEEVRTSEEAAKVRKEPLKIGAKAIVCFADKKPILIVVPGDRKIDFKKFKLLYNIKDLRMASSEEVTKLTTVPIGAVPPLGSVMNLRTYCDEKVFENNKIAFNAGDRKVTIKMKAKDFKTLESLLIEAFSLPK